MKKTIRFHVGGPAFHPVAEQAAVISGWLGDGYHCEIREGLAAFEGLETCDLFVPMGLHWTGMATEKFGRLTYNPLQEKQQKAYEAYVRSGRPLLIHHGAIASYDDWPRFGELLGLTWVWGTTSHSPIGDYTVTVRPTGHPVTKGIADFALFDELYYKLQPTPGVTMETLAEAEFNGERLPMVLAYSGGRVEGAGRAVYLANGHDLRAFKCDALRQLWVNSVRWLLQEN